MSAETLISIIAKVANKEHGSGATPEEIKTAEFAIGNQFSTSYLLFLKGFGWVRIFTFEIYGVGHDVPPHLDLVRNCDAERTIMRPNLPLELIPIMNDGSGNHFCLDTSRMNDRNECPIVFWDHETFPHLDPNDAAPSFDNWLVGLINEELA